MFSKIAFLNKKRSSACQYGFITINLICILLFSFILLGSSMSFWNILRVKRSLGAAIKKTRTHWALEEEAHSYQLDTLQNVENPDSRCSTSPDKDSEIILLQCKDQDFKTERNFIFVSKHE